MRTDFSNAKDSSGMSRSSAFNLNAAGKDQSASRFNDGGAAGADRAGLGTLQAVAFAPEEELERWDGMG
jgi:hypothetical protein